MGRISKLFNQLGDGAAWGCLGFCKLYFFVAICILALGLPLWFVYWFFSMSFFYLFLFFFPDNPAFNGPFISVLSLCCAVMVLVMLTVFFYRRRKRSGNEEAGKKESGREKLGRKLLPALGLALLWAFLLSLIVTAPFALFALFFAPNQGTQIFLTTVGPRSLATLFPLASQEVVSLTPGDTLRLTNSTGAPLTVCVKTDPSCDVSSGFSLSAGQTTAIVMDQEGNYLLNCAPLPCNLEISVHPSPPEQPGDG